VLGTTPYRMYIRAALAYNIFCINEVCLIFSFSVPYI
jgi:hypothetical protein